MNYEQALAWQMQQAARTALQIPRMVAGQPVSPGGAQPVMQQPWVAKPPGGLDFDQINTAQVVLPAIGAEAVVVSFLVPAGMNGVIKQLANQFVGGGWTEGTGDLIWRLQVDRAAVRNYENIIASLGSLTSPRDFGAGGIRIFENQLVELIARNVAIVVALQPLLGKIAGWFYPIQYEEGASSWL